MIKKSMLNNPPGLKFLQYIIFISEDAVRMQSLRYQILFFFDIDVISVHFSRVNGTSEKNFWLTDSIDVAFGDIVLENNHESYTWLSIHSVLSAFSSVVIAAFETSL